MEELLPQTLLREGSTPQFGLPMDLQSKVGGRKQKKILLFISFPLTSFSSTIVIYLLFAFSFDKNICLGSGWAKICRSFSWSLFDKIGEVPAFSVDDFEFDIDVIPHELPEDLVPQFPYVNIAYLNACH